MADGKPAVTSSKAEILPIAIIVLAAAGVCMFILLGKPISDRLGSGVFNATYQFLLVVVIGSGVSVLFQAITHARDTRERRRTLQREIHSALMAGYNDAKRARRLLRARARGQANGTAAIDPVQYDSQLESLSSAQLAIELSTRRIELNRSIFPDATELIAALRIIARYLNTIVDEWEDVRPLIGASHEPVPIATLPALDGFLVNWHESAAFREGFKQPVDTVLRLLERALAAEA